MRAFPSRTTGGSLIFQSECQMRYISACIDHLIAGGLRTMELHQDEHDAYVARHRAEVEQLVWSHPSIKHSSFKNADGDVYTANPWRLVDYWNWTKAPRFEHYEVR